MTYNNIYEFFKDDKDWLRYFHPLSKAATNEEAAMETLHILYDHAKCKKCHYVSNEKGYIFYSDRELISFCIKPEHRNKATFKWFWNFIKKNIGKHFTCYLYSNNTRAINYLMRSGMKIKKHDKLLTLLNI